MSVLNFLKFFKSQDQMSKTAPSSKRVGNLESLLRNVVVFDERSSVGCFNYFQRSSLLRIIAEVVTLSCDESVLFPLFCINGFVLLYLFGGQEFIGRRLLRIYGDLGALCLIESGFKLIVRRTRPHWRKQSNFLCMLGEQYSFPSGHTMRAAYLAIILVGEHGLNLRLHHHAATEMMFVLWACAVGVSRVALGKHFCFDVAIGAMLGRSLALGPYPSQPADGWVRFLLASAFSVEAVVIVNSPNLRADVKGWPFLVGIVVVFWITFPLAK